MLQKDELCYATSARGSSASQQAAHPLRSTTASRSKTQNITPFMGTNTEDTKLQFLELRCKRPYGHIHGLDSEMQVNTL
jgi:hypothetical protein